ncbi:MAG TPA: class I SAM-dependent methyltransferase [Chloroflexia bacterium]|nr:class I SAM-dependent methyltransferase [Chloroflexia bacterium]
MSTPGSYDVRKEHRDTESEIERLRAQALLHWEQEAAALTRFGLRDGMSVLELGSGPGFITEQLLRLVPGSTVTCLEIDSMLVERAREYLTGTGGDRLSFVNASIMDTGLPGNSFDFAYARFLFQHLPDPTASAREVLRVLKPGGKLVISDVDDALVVFEPRLPEFELALARFAQAQAAQGGDRFIGRKLPRLLKGAGFRNPQIELPAFHTDVIGMEAALPQIDADRLLPLVQFGLLTQEEWDAARVARERFLESDPFIMMALVMAGAEK